MTPYHAIVKPVGDHSTKLDSISIEIRIASSDKCLTIAIHMWIARDLPRTVLREVSETKTGTVEVFIPKASDEFPNRRIALELKWLHTVSNARDNSASNQLSRAVCTGLDDTANDHDHTAQSDYPFSAQIVTPDGRYKASS